MGMQYIDHEWIFCDSQLGTERDNLFTEEVKTEASTAVIEDVSNECIALEGFGFESDSNKQDNINEEPSLKEDKLILDMKANANQTMAKKPKVQFIMNPKPELISFECNLCNFSTVHGQMGLRKHRRVKHNIYDCPECGFSTKHQPSFKIHLESHRNDRPWVCDICGKQFKKKIILDEHRNTHTGKEF